jgi:uncharacterized membrane protein YesL
VKKLCILFLLLSLSGCSLLGFLGEPQKIIKNVTITGVTYAVGGWIPATAVAITAITVDKVLPDPEPQISEITNEVQMKAFIISNLTDNILYGAIAALLIFLIVVPWATQRRAKRQMKYDAMKRELDARRIKDAN